MMMTMKALGRGDRCEADDEADGEADDGADDEADDEAREAASAGGRPCVRWMREWSGVLALPLEIAVGEILSLPTT